MQRMTDLITRILNDPMTRAAIAGERDTEQDSAQSEGTKKTECSNFSYYLMIYYVNVFFFHKINCNARIHIGNNKVHILLINKIVLNLTTDRQAKATGHRPTT